MIDQQHVIRSLQHRALMLAQFKADAADAQMNAKAFWQSCNIWSRQGYPEIAAAAAEIARRFELQAACLATAAAHKLNDVHGKRPLHGASEAR